MSDKSQDVALILKLYELRREEGLRRARSGTSPSLLRKAPRILPGFLPADTTAAHYRMITSYWEWPLRLSTTAESTRKCFWTLTANTSRCSRGRSYIEEVRKITGMPDYLRQLETLVNKTPNSKERLERMRGLFGRWSKVAREASSAT